MKKSLKILFLLFLSVTIFIGCSKDDDGLTKDPIVATETGDTLEAILAMGFTKDQIEDAGDYYLVSGDIVFYKNKEYGPSDGETEKQRRHPNLVAISNINIYLNPGMGLDWRNASLDAIARWNNLNSSLNLTVTTSLSNANIHIMYDTHDPEINLASNVFGRGSWPTTNGLPGTKIWVNPDFTFCNSSSTRVSNVQHELGHNLGITHTNDGSFGIQIPGTPTSDSQSVMNGGAACSITNFSSYDVTAIQYLYPPAPTYSVTGDGPTYMPAGTNAISWEYTGNVANVQSISWWYKKVGNTGGAPYVIATGSNVGFAAFSDTYYSDPSTASSYFEIYIKVTTTSGDTYTSGTYTILKKGKYKLGGLF